MYMCVGSIDFASSIFGTVPTVVFFVVFHIIRFDRSWVKPMTLKLVLVASLLSTQH